MKIFALAFFSLLVLSACSTSHGVYEDLVVRSSRSAAMGASKAANIVTIAKSFEGTRYRFGGTDSEGMDCSGLVYTCFKEEAIELPRTSKDMATEGMPITLSMATKGDLLFFQTSRKRKVINHVGIVVEVDGTDIKFIHSTNSQGVIISSMEESYWRNSFIEARRVI